jgi:hypothetical protein
MKSSKPIERLFQEGLKDFQASPSQKVWDGIEEKLTDKKNRRRFIPFWWQVASVAAILLIFSSIGAYYNSSLGTTPSITSKENSSIRSTSNSLEVIPTRYRFSSVNENISTFEKSIENRLAFQITEPQKKTISTSQTKFWPSGSVENTRLAQSSPLSVNQLNTLSVKAFSENRLAPTLIDDKAEDNSILDDKVNKKKSLFDAIEEDNLLAIENDNSVDRPWEVKPNVAPVFMNSLNGGNPIEPSLQGKTSSNANVSFGVNVAYAINKKVKIRTGVNQVAMGYNTQDVILSATSSSFRSESSGNLNVKNDLIGDVALISASNRSGLNESMGEINSPSNLSPVGAINHELGFVEVPLEVEYALIDKRIGVHVLGGASTYLLNNNEIFFEDNGRSSSIGEADNLNSFSFSANLGVGMDYNFSETVSFNLEPKFMYQINTFQNNTSNFQPYFFGIYSGIKFKF